MQLLKNIKTDRIAIILIVCFQQIELKSQHWALNIKNKKQEIDSIVIYDLNQIRIDKLDIIKQKEQLIDFTEYIYVIYSNKTKVCIKEKLINFSCDTITINVSQLYKCKSKRHITIISYSYCNSHGLGVSDYSLYYPCCKDNYR